jgi:hypothetical protein
MVKYRLFLVLNGFLQSADKLGIWYFDAEYLAGIIAKDKTIEVMMIAT